MKLVFAYVFLLGSLAPLHSCAPAAERHVSSLPTKAASTSLCGDTYLQVFAPEHIAALSWQSRSEISLASEAQKTLPQIDASPERVYRFSNNLVLFGPGEGLTLSPILSHAVTLNWVEDFEGVADNARSLLSVLDLNTEHLEIWEEELETLRNNGVNLKNSMTPRLLYLTPSGGSAGPNTFVDAVIETAGGININQTQGWHSPNVETLIQYNPDIIVMSFVDTHYHSRSHIMTPAIENYLSDKTVITLKGGYWPCAGPYLLEAAQEVQEAIRHWQKSESQDV